MFLETVLFPRKAWKKGGCGTAWPDLGFGLVLGDFAMSRFDEPVSIVAFDEESAGDLVA